MYAGIWIGSFVVVGVDVDDGLEDDEDEGGRKLSKWVDAVRFRIEVELIESERLSMSSKDGAP